MSAVDQTWYLAQLKPNGLHLALRNLKRQGVTVFMPLHESTRRVKGKFATVTTPLFQGYLFVALNAQNGDWRTINNTRGVSKLVGFGEKPSPVPQALISEIKSRCDQADNLLPAPKLNEGDLVELTKGPFSDFVATVELVTQEQRVWLLLEVLGGPTRISVGRDSVRNVTLTE
ncbi:MAG: transcriptional activator RfaH [Rhizobiaceae bacterium]